MFYLSLDPQNYFFHGGEGRARWVWPWRGVLLLEAATICEAIAFYFLAKFALDKKIIRSLVILTVIFGWLVLNIMMSMHQPVFFFYHAWWLISLLVCSLIVLLYVGINAIASRAQDA